MTEYLSWTTALLVALPGGIVCFLLLPFVFKEKLRKSPKLDGMCGSLGTIFLIFYVVVCLWLLSVCRDFDFSREYGQLIRSHLKQVSFDQSQCQGDNRLGGKIILCNEDGTRYRHVASDGVEWVPSDWSIPEAMRSQHCSDVTEIVFIRQQESITGQYDSGSGKNAWKVTMSVCVVNVALGKVVAIYDAVGTSPGMLRSREDPHDYAYTDAIKNLHNWVCAPSTLAAHRQALCRTPSSSTR